MGNAESEATIKTNRQCRNTSSQFQFTAVAVKKCRKLKSCRLFISVTNAKFRCANKILCLIQQFTPSFTSLSSNLNGYVAFAVKFSERKPVDAKMENLSLFPILSNTDGELFSDVVTASW